MSAIKAIFNARKWSNISSRIFGKAGSLFSSATTKVKFGWGYLKRFWGRNPNLMNTIVGGVTVGYISRALYDNSEDARMVSERNARRFGAGGGPCGPDPYSPATLALMFSHHVDNIVVTLGAIQYTQPESDRRRELLLVFAQQYHDLIMNQSPDDTDFSVTVDKIMGSAYRLGIKPELAKNSPVLLAAMINAKDDDTNPKDIAADLTNLLYLDSFSIPLTRV